MSGQTTMTWEQWNALPDEYRGLRPDPTVSGGVRPYALTYDPRRGTVWGPVRLIETPSEPLEAS